MRTNGVIFTGNLSNHHQQSMFLLSDTLWILTDRQEKRMNQISGKKKKKTGSGIGQCEVLIKIPTGIM